jgi:hypothetical protein
VSDALVRRQVVSQEESIREWSLTGLKENPVCFVFLVVPVQTAISVGIQFAVESPAACDWKPGKGSEEILHDGGHGVKIRQFRVADNRAALPT